MPGNLSQSDARPSPSTGGQARRSPNDLRNEFPSGRLRTPGAVGGRVGERGLVRRGLSTLEVRARAILTVVVSAHRSTGRIAGTVRVALVMTLVFVLCIPGCGGSESGARGKPVVLVAGDSLVAAATADLTNLSPPEAVTAVLAGVGASPCDLWAGYRAPPAFGGRYLSFRAAVHSERPAAVVLAFSGNPGLSVHACITKPTTAYTLSRITVAYRDALRSMGTLATRNGARVYLSAIPARNPRIPEGWKGHTQYGYNGDPAFNTMMSGLARAMGWTYDTGAAAAISGAHLGWTLYLPCQPGTGEACVNGRERVRFGGTDAIHCDAPGTNGTDAPSDGSLRFARGLLLEPLASLGLQPLRQATSSPTTIPRSGCVVSSPTTDSG